VLYALDETERDRALARIAADSPRTKPVVTRFKGLGEMNPPQLRETTMAPQTRRLVQMTIDAHDSPDALLDMLLAKKRAVDRREWLESKGNLARV
jgi:topoisomerase-4 subunit B